jgi:hypothetical protein
MPKGMKPIRFFGLNGLPVLGYPVQNINGELGAAKWKKRHGYAPEVDGMFNRLISALTIRSQPTRLKILANAERFAANNLDEKTKRYFMPTGNIRFGQNEFSRKERHQEFLKRYSKPLANLLPQMPWEFMYIKRTVLGKYNDGTGRFDQPDLSGPTIMGDFGRFDRSVAAIGA